VILKWSLAGRVLDFSDAGIGLIDFFVRYDDDDDDWGRNRPVSWCCQFSLKVKCDNCVYAMFS
jgi:hypothetical protein